MKVVALSIFTMLVMNSLFAQKFSHELPSEITTTIAHVNGDTILVNNDNRTLTLDESLEASRPEILEAQKNGWEVKLIIKNYRIIDFYIVAKENVLAPTVGYTPIRGFEPLIADSKREINRLFKSMYPYSSDYYDVDDNCYNRAEYWARTFQFTEFQDAENRGTDKVFILFTEGYNIKFKHKWWYHVAPTVYLKNKETPYVFDPTFINKAVPLSEWLATFDGETEGKCEQIDNLNQFYVEDRPICMYIVASMFNYIPTDLEVRGKLRNWRCRDFKEGVFTIPAPGSKTSNLAATWEDSDLDYVLPPKCRK